MSAATAEREASRTSLAWARRRQRAGEAWREFRKHRAGLIGLGVLLAVVMLALLAPVIAPAWQLDPTKVSGLPNQAPSLADPLGTDPDGRSVLVMILWGSRVSLLVGFAATFVSMVIGTFIGMAAGHFGGLLGGFLMRVVDFFLILPGLVLAIVLASILGPSVWTIIIAIGVTSWAGTARLVRSQTLTIEARPYVERSWVLGAGHGHILGAHVLPAVMALVLANTTLSVGGAIISEATLAFLGLEDPTTISWGAMLQESLNTGAASGGYWWYVLAPGIAILVVVMAFTLVGQTLETVTNPNLRKR